MSYAEAQLLLQTLRSAIKFPEQRKLTLEEGAWADILLQTSFRPVQTDCRRKLIGILHRTGSHEEIQPYTGFCLRYPAIPRNQTGEERTVRALSESTSKAWCTHIVTHYILKNSNGRLSDFRISGLGLWTTNFFHKSWKAIHHIYRIQRRCQRSRHNHWETIKSQSTMLRTTANR